jgi:hypothetical protein
VIGPGLHACSEPLLGVTPGLKAFALADLARAQSVSYFDLKNPRG